ncbi:TPA: hypothetical protein ACNB0W_001081 [Escherichia coli]|nr:hypothetical protein [Escherichia coli]EJV4778707.1 hypothetical protein [Shigella dysenteriae]EHU7966499.1 hypothetical protein [Escherichia coli]EJK8022194.1 hypothetical protein [Escherichia coli]EJV7473857.1 hypothetical protein [Escherichia coli]EJW0434662.1 hypothetical protein [Escherichia coli]
MFRKLAQSSIKAMF